MHRNVTPKLIKNQQSNLITVGIDMGFTLWAVGFTNWSTGKYSYKGYKGETKEIECFEKIKEYVKSGYKVHVFYEAGRNGYTPARFLKELGAEVTILPVGKLKIICSGKQVKTDRIDARFLSELHPSDDLPSVHIATLEEESRISILREQERIETDIKRKNNQILSILERFLLPKVKTHKNSSQWKELLRNWKTQRLLQNLTEIELYRIHNLIDEIEFLEKHILEVCRWIAKEEQKEREVKHTEKTYTAIEKMMQFKGIAEVISRKFSWYLISFERFKNGKSLSSYLGLCPVPWCSGKMNKDQGISKSGRRELRRIAIEMAWLWVKWQPDSDIVKKWQPKLKPKGRSRKTAIVALARQLIVALYRHIVHGDEIKGAVINKPLVTF